MGRLGGKVKKRIFALISCSLLGLVPAIQSCADNDAAYGPAPSCSDYPYSCASTTECETQCGAGWYCDFPPDADASTRGTCTEVQP